LPTHPKRACISCRISEDREGLENGVGTQEADRTDLINGQGWELGRVYVDNDISASTLSRQPRPDYEQMTKGVEAGVWNVIASLTNGRLIRRPMDLERLIILHDQIGVLITAEPCSRVPAKIHRHFVRHPATQHPGRLPQFGPIATRTRPNSCLTTP
jgi:hypothetical protein